MLFPLPEIKTQIVKVSHSLKLRILGEEGRGDVWISNSNEVRLRLRERPRLRLSLRERERERERDRVLQSSSWFRNLSLYVNQWPVKSLSISCLQVLMCNTFTIST